MAGREVETKPYLIEARFTVAVADTEAAGHVFDLLTEKAESIGLLPEGGFCELMKDEDVIPGSPLAKSLGWEAPRG